MDEIDDKLKGFRADLKGLKYLKTFLEVLDELEKDINKFNLRSLKGIEKKKMNFFEVEFQK